MTDFTPPMDGQAILARLVDPAIRIVSLTVTEGGYFIDPATGAFDPDAPEIRADAAAPDAPATVFGLILAGLRSRRAAGVPPFTVLSCDNIPPERHRHPQHDRRARRGAGSRPRRLGPLRSSL
jgi:mannitol 2-dehydrogenase